MTRLPDADGAPQDAPVDAALPRVVAALRAAGCVFAEAEAELLLAAADHDTSLDAMVRERCAGAPLEHVLGRARFGGIDIVVRPPVFVPRRRTEQLVMQALNGLPASPVVVDLCCGSGAVGAVIANRVPDAVVHAADIEPNAVECARENLARFGPQHRVHEGDLFDPLPVELRGTVDVVTANVPYVPSAEITFLPREARDHEPLSALDGGADGLDLLRRVAEAAPGWLRPNGRVLFEVSTAQRRTALSVLAAAGLRARSTDEDEGTVVVIGTLDTRSRTAG